MYGEREQLQRVGPVGQQQAQRACETQVGEPPAKEHRLHFVAEGLLSIADSVPYPNELTTQLLRRRSSSKSSRHTCMIWHLDTITQQSERVSEEERTILTAAIPQLDATLASWTILVVTAFLQSTKHLLSGLFFCLGIALMRDLSLISGTSPRSKALQAAHAGKTRTIAASSTYSTLLLRP